MTTNDERKFLAAFAQAYRPPRKPRQAKQRPDQDRPIPEPKATPKYFSASEICQTFSLPIDGMKVLIEKRKLAPDAYAVIQGRAYELFDVDTIPRIRRLLGKD